MCPHGYHHSGSMATPALGTRDVRSNTIYTFTSSRTWTTGYISQPVTFDGN